MSPRSTGSRRLTIAVLLDHLNFFGRGYEGQLRDALHTRCRRVGHNLLFLYGGALDAPNPQEAADNAIFRLPSPGDFDGIVVMSTLLSAFCGPAGVGQLIHRLQPAHLCSLGASYPGIPSLVVDNRSGLELVTEHLIHDHGCRRPAFLAGTPKNPDSDERFQGFAATLERHGIPIESSRVASGHFLPSLGRAAMDELLDRKVGFDAVVAANDSMAIGAIQALRKRGLRVPQDIPVTGFDDLTLARLCNPPLTTVAQPFEILADLAVGLIEDQAAGRQVPELTQIPSQFVRRQSCGCGYRTPGESCSSLPQLGGSVVWRERLDDLKPALADLLRTASVDVTVAASRLCDGLHSEIVGEKEAFQKAVAELLVDVGDDSECHRTLQSAINRLRNEMSDEPDLHLESAFYDALSLVALSNTTAQVQHRLGLDENYLRLLTVGEQASAAFDLASLRDSLVRSLPAAGVRTALLSCLPDHATAEFETVVCFLDGIVQPPGKPRFPSSQLLPPEVLRADRVSTLLLFPLTHDQQLLGVIAFDHSDGNNAYIAFRNQIASVLKNIRLHQDLMNETMLHERSVQERLATTKRMEALSVLAGGVAHDLNNALGPLVVLPDVILEQLAGLAIPEQEASELRADVESMKTASLRAAQTIKDLLTLGRQGKMAKQDLDLNRVVKSCVLDTPWGLGTDGSSSVNLHLDLVHETLTLGAAESQLARAISNLVRNAVEATDGRGEVIIKTSRAQLQTPRAGFENIPPGSYVVLTISDNGSGISAQDMGRIFEPFFTKKRAGESSGTGLGLAIVHGVVKEHDGFIDVTSTLKMGTTFTLYFPAVQPPPPQLETPSVAPRGNATILIVDDEPIQLRTCRRVLVHLGYSVETAASGPDALERFHQAALTGQSPFDVVIVDLLLREAMDGLEVLEEIHTLFPKQKAIVVSGQAPTERADLAAKRGLTWLTKPYNIESLAHAVANILRGGGAG